MSRTHRNVHPRDALWIKKINAEAEGGELNRFAKKVARGKMSHVAYMPGAAYPKGYDTWSTVGGESAKRWAKKATHRVVRRASKQALAVAVLEELDENVEIEADLWGEDEGDFDYDEYFDDAEELDPELNSFDDYPYDDGYPYDDEWDYPDYDR